MEAEKMNLGEVVFDARVLLVEDSPISQMVAKEALSFFGLDVDLAGNGQDAVEKILCNRYDLIFMDCQMPVMDGYEASAEIRKLEEKQQIEKVPIVALTALSSLRERMQIFESGADDYLAKPFQMNELFTCLIKWLKDQKKVRSSGAMARKKEKNPEPKIKKEASCLDEGILERLLEVENLTFSSDLLEELFEIFSVSSRDLLQQLDRDIVFKSFEGVRKKAHRLKSSSYHIGAVNLSDLLGKLELAALKQDLDTVTSLFTQIQEEHGAVLDEIQKRLKG